MRKNKGTHPKLSKSRRDRKLDNFVKTAIKSERDRMWNVIASIPWYDGSYNWTPDLKQPQNKALIPGIVPLLKDLQKIINPNKTPKLRTNQAETDKEEVVVETINIK